MPSLETSRWQLPPANQWLQNDGGVVTTGIQQPGKALVGSCKTFQGSRKEGFFVPGKYRVNPVYISERKASIRPGIVRHEGKNGGRWLTYEVSGLPCWNSVPSVISYPALDPNLAAQTLSKAYAKSYEVQAELGVFLGELRETLAMLRNPFQAFLKFGNSLRRKNSAFTGFGSLNADVFLQYKYGILPLINDVNTILALFNKRASKRLKNFHRKRGTGANSTSSKVIKPSGFGICTFDDEIRTTTEWKSYSTVYYEKVINDSLLSSLQILGLSPYQIPEILLELVTLSFVIEWFYGIGAWLKLLAPNALAFYLGNTTSQVTVYKLVVQTCRQTPIAGFSCTLATPYRYELEERALHRIVGSTPPVTPVFKGFDLSIDQTISSLALTWQRLMSRR